MSGRQKPGAPGNRNPPGRRRGQARRKRRIEMRMLLANPATWVVSSMIGQEGVLALIARSLVLPALLVAPHSCAGNVGFSPRRSPAFCTDPPHAQADLPGFAMPLQLHPGSLLCRSSGKNGGSPRAACEFHCRGLHPEPVQNHAARCSGIRQVGIIFSAPGRGRFGLFWHGRLAQLWLRFGVMVYVDWLATTAAMSARSSPAAPGQSQVTSSSSWAANPAQEMAKAPAGLTWTAPASAGVSGTRKGLVCRR